jgi:hypothetical protein
MPNQSPKDSKTYYAAAYLPWALGGLMFVVYCLTLNRWTNVQGVDMMSRLSGFQWIPSFYFPLSWLATLPLRWVPVANIPLAANLYSAICGALVLTILARCVAILPQDRTELQRQREKSDFGFLTGWPSFIPPVLAVLLMGLQMTFWVQSTCFAFQMIELLLFAFIVWQLMEYRLDEKPWRIFIVCVAYGAGLAETPVWVGFFPVLLTAIIWLKKLDFFSVRFLSANILGGLMGMLLFLLLPITAKMNPHFHLGIWEILRPNISNVWMEIKMISYADVRIQLAQASLATLLPLLLMAIRWSSSYGDNSRIGVLLAGNMLHFVHAAVFTVCVWVMFDPPFSPIQILGGSNLFLNFFSALSIGYCCGYFLLIFGRKPIPAGPQAGTDISAQPHVAVPGDRHGRPGLRHHRYGNTHLPE